jgi:hypothetical protein
MKGLPRLAFLVLIAASTWSPFAHAADKPTPPDELLRKRMAYLTRVMLTDGYEKGGWKDPAWDDNARKVIELHIRKIADDPSVQPDDQDALHEALGRCTAAQCADVFVQYIGARNLPHLNAPRDVMIKAHLGLSWQHDDLKTYTPQVRADVYLRGAKYAAMSAADKLGLKYSSAGWPRCPKRSPTPT